MLSNIFGGSKKSNTAEIIDISSAVEESEAEIISENNQYLKDSILNMIDAFGIVESGRVLFTTNATPFVSVKYVNNKIFISLNAKIIFNNIYLSDKYYNEYYSVIWSSLNEANFEFMTEDDDIFNIVLSNKNEILILLDIINQLIILIQAFPESLEKPIPSIEGCIVNKYIKLNLRYDSENLESGYIVIKNTKLNKIYNLNKLRYNALLMHSENFNLYV